MRLLFITTSPLAVLLVIGLAIRARSGGPAQQELSKSTTDQMTGSSAADALLGGVNVGVIRAPQRKPSESGSVARWLIAHVRPTALISSRLLRSGSAQRSSSSDSCDSRFDPVPPRVSHTAARRKRAPRCARVASRHRSRALGL